jgi:hypothetical protein
MNFKATRKASRDNWCVLSSKYLEEEVTVVTSRAKKRPWVTRK